MIHFKSRASLLYWHPSFHYSWMIGIILALTLRLFVSGYRLTADDVLFHQTMMDGWAASWDFIKAVSFAQGRIVHFLDLPFSLIGAYYADNIYFRLLYTALYFSNFFLFANYISTISGIQATRLIFIILLSFHPLDYFHLSPNSYPLHISIPIFLILLSRILLLKARNRDVEEIGIREVLYLIICFVGMMFSEYGFLFALALIFCEIVARIALHHASSKHKGNSIRFGLAHRDTWKDFFLIILFFCIYAGFRWAYPSSYEGNQLAKNFNTPLFLKTLFGHIYGGTSLPALARDVSSTLYLARKMSIFDWTTSAAVFLLTLLLTRISLLQILKHPSDSSWMIPRSIMIFFGGIAFAIIITVPIAMTGKYQDWCQHINTCIFLDSRISYLGIGASFAGLVLLISTWLKNISSPNLASLTIGLTISLGAFMTYAHNLSVQRDMKDFVSAWDRARTAACFSTDQLKNMNLSESIDPNHRINHHLDFDLNEYWEKYLKDQNQKLDCGLNSGKLRDFYPRFAPGRRLLTGKSGGALSLLKVGWSQPEPWGTWSEGSAATVEIPVGTGRPTSVQVEAKVLLSSTHPKQDVDVLVNGIPAIKVRLTAESKGRFEVPIPQEAIENAQADQPITLEFRFPDAARPRDIGLGEDSRKLAIGLVALTLR